MKVVRPFALRHELKRARHPHQSRSNKVSVAVKTCVDFLPKVPSRSQGGVALTVEFVLSEDRPTPMLRATFALAVLVLTTKGDACTFAQLKEMFRRAGFWQSTLRALEPSAQHTAISRK